MKVPREISNSVMLAARTRGGPHLTVAHQIDLTRAHRFPPPESLSLHLTFCLQIIGNRCAIGDGVRLEITLHARQSLLQSRQVAKQDCDTDNQATFEGWSLRSSSLPRSLVCSSAWALNSSRASIVAHSHPHQQPVLISRCSGGTEQCP